MLASRGSNVLNGINPVSGEPKNATNIGTSTAVRSRYERSKIAPPIVSMGIMIRRKATPAEILARRFFVKLSSRPAPRQFSLCIRWDV